MKSNLETPVLLADYDKLVQNIKNMQRVADDAGVVLRPHTKTHKCPEIASLQLAEGASGICVQKISEAEVMVEAGIRDIFITNQIVEPSKIHRLVGLQDRARVKVAVDSLENAEAINKIASPDRPVPVLLEVDCGMRRCGVPFGPSSIKLAHEIALMKGLSFEGVTTYEGQLYRISNPRRRLVIAKRLIGQVVETAKRIRKLGLGGSIVSCGSTPTAIAATQVPGVTEIQPGNYVFYDIQQVELGSTKVNNCALTVMATVISSPDSKRAVVDAGTKAFSHDQGQLPVALNMSGVKPIGISEEHLMLKINPKEASLRIGDKIEFIPYHACTAANMYDQIRLVRADDIVATWPIAGRGKIL